MMYPHRFSEQSISDFLSGQNIRCYDFLGAHMANFDGLDGVNFVVWAPFVRSVRVVGDFNNWQGDEHYMQHISSGIWSIFISGVCEGANYKFLIEAENGNLFYKADPYAYYSEVRPATASRVFSNANYVWHDEKWMKKRAKSDHFKKPLNIYEVHLGSWKQKLINHSVHTDAKDFYTYREIADTLLPYVLEMGYTHIEIMPLMEHPFDGSWGYQVTGYFSPTSRYGTPDDLKYFIDSCHAKGIGVIFDWVPGHFCPDAHGLANFNGEMLYENDKHHEWGTYKFDFGRGEVRSFLFSSAMYWFDIFHIDGIRIDGVTSMVYLNYGIEDESKHRYNPLGGNKDLEALSFLSQLNQKLALLYPGSMSMAEESTALPLVTYPPHEGGLGFHYKWDMGWMNDTLEYFSLDFPYRPHHHNLLTFSTMYAYNENFILSLSHDEVVHGKKSLIDRMPGDYWRQFANMRLLYLYQMTHTGAKLNFMGNEIAQFIEWRYYEGIEWQLTEYDKHRQYNECVKSLNKLYLKEKTLWEINYSHEGFEWQEADNNSQGVLIYKRKSKDEEVIVVLNFQPNCYFDYRIGVPTEGKYKEIFNSDEIYFGGSGKVNPKAIKAEKVPMHGNNYSVNITLPPLGGVILKKTRAKKSTSK